MSAVSSSSTSRPIDTMRSMPEPTGTSFGAILPLPSAAFEPASRPFTPSIRGIEKPQMSASRTPTVRPRAASAAARFAVIDDLPTPPLPLPTAMTRVVAGTSVAGADWDARRRAFCISSERSSWVISSYSTRTSATPGRPATLERTSVPIWPRSGHAAVVRATLTTTSPFGSTRTA